MNKDFEKDDLVRSKQGHDQGRIYLVTAVIDENYVSLADGVYRGLKKQKRKRKKHLVYLGHAQTEEKITDVRIKKIIKDWRNNAERG